MSSDTEMLAYFANFNTMAGRAGRSIDPTKPGPDADRIAELEREIAWLDWGNPRTLEVGLPSHVRQKRLNEARAELARLHNEQPKGGGRAIPCSGCGATKSSERCIGCLHDFGDPDSAWVRRYHVSAPSPSPSPEPQDVREALLATKRTLAAYQKQGASHAFVGDISLQKVNALIDAALAQSDAQPVGWRDGVQTAARLCRAKAGEYAKVGDRHASVAFTKATGFILELLDTAPHRPDARIERMVSHCCVPEIDEPFFVLLGRDPQAPGLVEQWAADRKQAEPEAVDKWRSAAETACDMRNWKMAHPERGMSIEAFAKIAPHSPDASGLIEAAEWLADESHYELLSPECRKVARDLYASFCERFGLDSDRSAK